MQEVPLILKSLIECLFLRKPGLRAHQDVQSALVLLRIRLHWIWVRSLGQEYPLGREWQPISVVSPEEFQVRIQEAGGLTVHGVA